MITDFNKYKLLEADIYQMYFTDENRNLKEYLELIDSGELSEHDILRLFHWSCAYDFHELSAELVKKIKREDLLKHSRSIAYLDYPLFKKIIEKNNLYVSFLNNRDFLDQVFNNGKDKVKKLKLLKKHGFEYTDKSLRSACFHNSEGIVSVIKYFVSLGLDPSKKEKSTYSDQPQNCLDIATNYNDDPSIIRYLVKNLNIPVTYRHISNVISKDNLKSVPILTRSKNIIEDYSYSSWATHDENKHPYYLSRLIYRMGNKNLFKYLKLVFENSVKKPYNELQSLPSSSDSNIVFPKYLNIAYWIISNYNDTYINSYNTEYITKGHLKFWVKKMKEDPSIIKKLLDVDDDIKTSYEYQKVVLDADPKNLKYIEKKLNSKIKDEYAYLIDSEKFNI